MINYNCPDCTFDKSRLPDACNYCKRALEKDTKYDHVYSAYPCETCPNCPKPGETKICHCTLPYTYYNLPGYDNWRTVTVIDAVEAVGGGRIAVTNLNTK